MGSAAVSARDKRVATTAETVEWGKGKGIGLSGVRAKGAIERLAIYTIYLHYMLPYFEVILMCQTATDIICYY